MKVSKLEFVVFALICTLLGKTGISLTVFIRCPKCLSVEINTDVLSYFANWAIPNLSQIANLKMIISCGIHINGDCSDLGRGPTSRQNTQSAYIGPRKRDFDPGARSLSICLSVTTTPQKGFPTCVVGVWVRARLTCGSTHSTGYVIVCEDTSLYKICKQWAVKVYRRIMSSIQYTLKTECCSTLVCVVNGWLSHSNMHILPNTITNSTFTYTFS